MAAPNTHVNVAGTWKRVKGIYVRVGGVWKPVKSAHVNVSGSWKKFYNNRIAVNLTIASNQNDYNAYTAAGSPADGIPRDVVVTINSGIYLSSTSTATAALMTGGPWPTGSTFSIVNNGYIHGKGGAGGGGGAYSNGAGGGAGGPAIEFHSSLSLVSITNGSGNIFGGGGGGGGGGSLAYWSGYAEWLGGGGGGGGASYNGGAAGSWPGWYGPFGSTYFNTAGTNGAAGNSSGGGAAGTAARFYQNTGGESPTIRDSYSGVGGAGGGFGAAGSSGGNAYNATGDGYSPYGTPFSLYSGAGGGAAGKAVNLNGVSITWISGNDSARVKGAVS